MLAILAPSETAGDNDMQPDDKGRVRLDHPGPGLIGFRIPDAAACS
jgi:hypothetical protein